VRTMLILFEWHMRYYFASEHHLSWLCLKHPDMIFLVILGWFQNFRSSKKGIQDFSIENFDFCWSYVCARWHSDWILVNIILCPNTTFHKVKILLSIVLVPWDEFLLCHILTRPVLAFRDSILILLWIVWLHDHEIRIILET